MPVQSAFYLASYKDVAGTAKTWDRVGGSRCAGGAIPWAVVRATELWEDDRGLKKQLTTRSARFAARALSTPSPRPGPTPAPSRPILVPSRPMSAPSRPHLGPSRPRPVPPPPPPPLCLNPRGVPNVYLFAPACFIDASLWRGNKRHAGDRINHSAGSLSVRCGSNAHSSPGAKSE